jgi:hypothetical protein
MSQERGQASDYQIRRSPYDLGISLWMKIRSGQIDRRIALLLQKSQTACDEPKYF